MRGGGMSYDILLGRKFGRLTVMKEIEPKYDKNGRIYHQWKCKCDCGNYINVTSNNLKGNHTRSCGCLQREVAGQQTLKHGYRNTRLYRIYNTMKQRCNNPNNQAYKNYGGRGIKVCEEWNKKDGLKDFGDWALANGYKDNLTIDRINVDKGYSPDNCRWVDMKTQCNNTRRNVHLTYLGVDYTIAQFSRKYSIDHRLVGKLLRDGLSPSEILLKGKNNDYSSRHKTKEKASRS